MAVVPHLFALAAAVVCEEGKSLRAEVPEKHYPAGRFSRSIGGCKMYGIGFRHLSSECVLHPTSELDDRVMREICEVQPLTVVLISEKSGHPSD